MGRWRDDRLYARERLSGRALGAGGGSDRATEAAACQIGTASARVCPMAPTIAGGWMRVGRRRPWPPRPRRSGEPRRSSPHLLPTGRRGGCLVVCGSSRSVPHSTIDRRRSRADPVLVWNTTKRGCEPAVEVASIATFHSSLGGFCLPRPRRQRMPRLAPLAARNDRAHMKARAMVLGRGAAHPRKTRRTSFRHTKAGMGFRGLWPSSRPPHPRRRPTTGIAVALADAWLVEQTQAATSREAG